MLQSQVQRQQATETIVGAVSAGRVVIRRQSFRDAIWNILNADSNVLAAKEWQPVRVFCPKCLKPFRN